jgi:hypothetical protein
MELPTFEDRHTLLQIQLTSDSNLFEFIYLYLYDAVLRGLVINEANFKGLDQIHVTDIIRLLTTFKNNFINLLDALFINDVNNLIGRISRADQKLIVIHGFMN